MLIGYTRVSKADGPQSLDLQRDALMAEGVEPDRLHENRANGAKKGLPGLEAFLHALPDGDMLVVWS